ncbi:hypothetical protein CR513_41761, partial [Mucuna pruriens]
MGDEGLLPITWRRFSKGSTCINAKPMHVRLARHHKLNKIQCSKIEEGKKKKMIKVSYLLIVGSLMHAMICMKPNIGYVVVVSKILSNLGNLCLANRNFKIVFHYQPLKQNIFQCQKLIRKIYERRGSYNSMFHSRSKPIDIQYHLIQKVLDEKK